jgi:hypothetical protein
MRVGLEEAVQGGSVRCVRNYGELLLFDAHDDSDTSL